MTEVNKVPTVKLSNGHLMPMVGLGTFKTENEPEKQYSAIREAIKAGYRHFDCAYAYKNEDVVGRALNDAIKESNGKLKREDFFVTTKLWNTFHSRGAVIKSVDLQLKEFGFDYFDLYLIHWPMGYAENDVDTIFPTYKDGKVIPSDINYLETYKALEEVLESGKVKAIGVSNFNVEQLQDVLDNCKVKPAAVQVEIHPYYQNDDVVEFCQKHDIAVIAYCPLGGADRSWRKPEDPVLLEDEIINKLAKKYNKTPAQICLRWNTHRNVVVIPKSLTPSRIRDNIKLFDFRLSHDELREINKLNKNFKYYPCSEGKSHRYYPFHQ